MRLPRGHTRLRLFWGGDSLLRLRVHPDGFRAAHPGRFPGALGERDENEVRLSFSPSEKLAVAAAVERIEKPKAKQRRKEQEGRPSKKKAKITGENVSPVSKPKDKEPNRAAARAAKAVGSPPPDGLPGAGSTLDASARRLPCRTGSLAGRLTRGGSRGRWVNATRTKSVYHSPHPKSWP